MRIHEKHLRNSTMLSLVPHHDKSRWWISEFSDGDMFVGWVAVFHAKPHLGKTQGCEINSSALSLKFFPQAPQSLFFSCVLFCCETCLSCEYFFSSFFSPSNCFPLLYHELLVNVFLHVTLQDLVTDYLCGKASC